jgi:multisubunit Na+/H+ antiporter MnhE subunit
MKEKTTNILIAIFWLCFFSFIIYKGFSIVAIFSAILLGMTLAFATSNEV